MKEAIKYCSTQADAEKYCRYLGEEGINCVVDQVSRNEETPNSDNSTHRIMVRREDKKKAVGVIKDVDVMKLRLEDHHYYLHDFIKDELMEVLEKFDEWDRPDLFAARELLKRSGNEVSDADLKFMKESRIERLKLPEHGNPGWIMCGYLCAIAGGLLGILLGYYFFSSKKRIFTGERFYAFDTSTRKTGLVIFFISIIVCITAVIILFGSLK